MRRRDLLALVGGAAWLAPIAIAQQPKIPVIGVLVIGSPGWQQFWQMFREAMRDLGYIEGQTVRYEFRSDEGLASRLPELATELVALNVDVIVPWFTPAATAAKRATSTIPIVMASVGDPVATGLVESLAHPGGNVTGSAAMAADLAGKSVEMIRGMLPAARRVVVLVNSPDPFSKPFLERIRQGGDAAAITIDPMMLRGSDDLESAFAAMQQQRPDAVIVQPSLRIQRAAELALQYRLPSVLMTHGFVEEGGLMIYSWGTELYRRTAVLVDKILKGAKPADLPVEQPTKFELVVNMKTAKALGLAIPPAFLARADELIE